MVRVWEVMVVDRAEGMVSRAVVEVQEVMASKVQGVMVRKVVDSKVVVEVRLVMVVDKAEGTCIPDTVT